MLDKLGYEYKMIFVNTSLENAQARNDMRSRKLPKEIVQGDWENHKRMQINLEQCSKEIL